MKFIIGEGLETLASRAAYDGTIGLFYKNTFYGMISYLLFGIVVLLALIGFFSVIKWLFKRRAKKKAKAAQAVQAALAAQAAQAAQSESTV